MKEYEPVLKLSDDFLGHGFDENGKLYEGYCIQDICKFFYVENGQEIIVK